MKQESWAGTAVYKASRGKTLPVFWLSLLLCLLSRQASAQSASATLDRDKILLGEQVTLQLRLSNIREGESFVARWPRLADSIGRAEIIKSSGIDTLNVNASTIYQQTFTLTSFDSGQWQLGPFQFTVQDKFTGRQRQLATEALSLSVLPVDVSAMQDYHPIKEIIDVPTSFNWKPVWITAVALLAAAVLLYLIRRKLKNRPTTENARPKGTPLERALEKLAALQTLPLHSVAASKSFHASTDEIARTYLQEALQVNALQLTGTELFARLRVYLQDEALRLKFQRLFQLNAAVKFAKYMPEAAESRQLLAEIKSCIEHIDESIKAVRTHADGMVSKH